MQFINNEQNNSVFKACDFFMLRTPLLAIEVYKELFCKSTEVEKEIFSILEKNHDVREAITIASLSLSNALDRFNYENNNRKTDQILSSLIKYMIRMTTRTTPYGVFSGVTLGNFNNITKVKLKTKEKHKKRARPDMEWLYAIIRMIENDQKILNELNVVVNDLCTINGSRLELGYISNYGLTLNKDSLDNITASVIYSDQVKLVLESAKDFIKYKDLLSILIKKNPNVSIERIKGFLDQLLKNEYLITDMRPPLTNISPFGYLISKLSEINSANKIYKDLVNIKTLIDEYNTLPIGDGKDVYLDIIKSMKVIKECKNYLQVDMSLAAEEVSLHVDIANEIENFAEVMLKLSSQSQKYDQLTDFINDFIKKYGTEREISVLELLDDDKGLGSPAGYNKPNSYRNIHVNHENPEAIKIQNFFANKVLHALMNKEQEVIITGEEIEKIKTKYTLDEIPNSLEINALVTRFKSENENDFRINIGPNLGSVSAGKSFGRFVDIMPQQIYQRLTQLHKLEADLNNEDTIFAEIVELPQSGRLSNVTLNWNPRDYELVIATNHHGNKETISIKDLYIGIERNSGGKNQFYLRSKSLNKKVIIKNNNMLNITLCSNIYRFICEVSIKNKRNIFFNLDDIYSNSFKNMNYTPRIRYNKVILYPALWKLNNELLSINLQDCSKQYFYEAIALWKSKWNVPDYVYLKEGDHRLLLNLNVELHINELYYLLKKESTTDLMITEIESGLENLIVQSDDGNYAMEIVVPIIKNKKISKDINKGRQIDLLETKSDYISKRGDLGTLDIKRSFFPGDEWIYLKLYGHSKRIDEFISFHMLPFCQELINSKEIEKFFFIRYADSERHIRLRLKINKKVLNLQIMEKLNIWFKRLISEGLMTRACFDTYVREVERYGGLELIELAEEIFYMDSIFVSNIINMKRSGNLNIPLDVLGVASIINILEESKINYEVQKEIFISYFDKSSFRELFQKDRKLFLNICNSNSDWLGLRQSEEGKILYNLFKMRSSSLNMFSDKMIEIDEKNGLCNSKIDIIFSIIHMHCNRLFDSTQKEREIMALARHTLQSLEYIKKI